MLTVDLTGKRILVTGATGNLGPTICRTLSSAGASLVVAYRSDQVTADRIVADCGGMAIQVDLASTDSVAHLANNALAEGPAWAIVHGATFATPWTPIVEQRTDDFLTQWQGSSGGFLRLLQAFTPHMSSGRIVAISSENASLNLPGMAAYSSAKASLESLVKIAAKELGPRGITVNAVAPGWIETGPEPDHWYEVPLGHRGSPEDVAHAVAFLCSDLAKFINGAILPVNGGRV